MTTRNSQSRPATQPRRRLLAMLCAAPALYAAGALAKDAGANYPSRPVRLLIPFPAGGPSDTVARAVATAMQPILGQPIVVENKTGAAGIVGTKEGAAAAPDGYTIILGGTGTHNTNQYLYDSLPYDPDKDFAAVSQLYDANNVFVVPADSPIKSLAGLIAQAKKRPGELNYAVGAIGSSSHLAFEMFKSMAGVDIAAIPYSGMLAAYTDLVGGRIQVLPNDVLNMYEQITAGKVRALAVTSAERFPFLPDVPTVAESGLPGFVGVGWAGLFVPAGTPAPIVEKISAAVREAANSPELRKSMEARKVELVASTPREFGDVVARERQKWAKVIRDANIKLQ